MRPKRVLLVEDNDDHAELVRRAFVRHASEHELLRVSDGEQALAYLSAADPASWPCLVLLDVRLPRVSGLDVLEGIRRLRDPSALPVVIWSTSENRGDIASAFERGANAYVVKPASLPSLDDAVRDLTRFWLAWNRVDARSKRLPRL